MSQEITKDLLHRVLSGKVPCKLYSRILYVHPPTIDVRCEASRIASETLLDAKYQGLLTKDQMFSLMLKHGLWSLPEEQQYTSMPAIIETLKLQMWQFYVKFASKRVDQTRKNLNKQRHTYNELCAKKFRFDMYTVEGQALLNKLDYIVANSTYDINGNIPDDIKDGRLIKALVATYISNTFNDSHTREIAKSPIWKTIWNAGKTMPLFNCSVSELTDEQISLINWSRMYDSIYENMECPSDTVIEDDDLLDGWLITQSRERENDRNKKMGDKFGDKKGLQEVFIPAETSEDANRIDAMNDPASRAIKRQRMQLAAKHGAVKEQNMPDSQLTMRQQALLEINKKIKGK